jgi:hypothetical protein
MVFVIIKITAIAMVGIHSKKTERSNKMRYSGI